MKKESKIDPEAEAIIEAHWAKHRPPEAGRAELDSGFSIDGYNIELFEIRPSFLNPERIVHLPYAKIQYVRSRKIWKLYWHRASGKWDAYDPFSESAQLEVMLNAVSDDAHGCFFG